MSQRDLVAELRAARIEAPPELRARVRLIAAADTTHRQRRHVHLAPRARRRPAGRGRSRGDDRFHATRPISHHGGAGRTRERVDHGVGAWSHGRRNHSRHLRRRSRTVPGSVHHARASATAPTSRCACHTDGVSTGVKQRASDHQVARRLRRLGARLNVGANAAVADLTLKVPRTHVQEAIARLSAIGTITAEQVDVQDLQAGLNATDRTIARLQRQLAALRAEPQSDPHRQRRSQLLFARSRACSAQRRPRSAPTRYATVRAASRHRRRRPPASRTTARCTVSASRSAGSGSARSTRSRSARRSLLVVWLAWIAARTIRRRREDALLSRS